MDEFRFEQDLVGALLREQHPGSPALARPRPTRARGWAVLRALHLISIGRDGRLGLPRGQTDVGTGRPERALAVN